MLTRSHAVRIIGRDEVAIAEGLAALGRDELVISERFKELHNKEFEGWIKRVVQTGSV
jgi:hypothetical protein